MSSFVMNLLEGNFHLDNPVLVKLRNAVKKDDGYQLEELPEQIPTEELKAKFKEWDNRCCEKDGEMSEIEISYYFLLGLHLGLQCFNLFEKEE